MIANSAQCDDVHRIYYVFFTFEMSYGFMVHE